ncbi:MAG TPA: C4-type zinc ribbon domain-containing protein [Polyangia bacterium]
MRADLLKIEKILGLERDKLAEAEKWRAEQEQQLKYEEDAIVKAKTKLQTVKTSREHMAADRELKSTRETKEEREGEILKLLEATAQTKKMIEAHEAQVATLRAEVDAEELVIKARIAELEQQAAGLRGARDEAAKAIKPDVLKRYRTIRMRRGLAVVPVSQGVCAGCHMSIPPQLYNNLQRGTSLELCPQCGRIIYFDQIMVEPEPEPEPVAVAPLDDEPLARAPSPGAAAQAPLPPDPEVKAASHA